MAKIYLVRHCESEGNATRRTQAQTDALVTVKGYEQAEILRRRFHDVHLDAVYSSDSFRSIMTADPVAKDKGLVTRVRISLREVTTGVWEDMAWGNIAQEYPEANQVWTDSPWDNITPGASAFRQVAENTIHCLRRIAKEVGKDGVAMAVSHSCTIKATLCMLSGKPMSCVKELGHGDNTSVSLLDVDEDGTIRIEYMNDDSHLPAALRRAWGGVAGSDINMAVYPCRLPQQAEVLLKLAAMDAAQRGLPFDGEAYLREAEALLSQHPDRIAFAYMRGEPCGFVRFDSVGGMPAGDVTIQQLYMIPAMQRKGYGEQLFGYACHVLRYENQSRIVMRVDGTEEERHVASRFAMRDMYGFPGYRGMDLYCPPCPYPVLA